MRHFIYVEPGVNDEPVEVTMSEKEILDSYWLYWCSQMELKYGKNHPLTTQENCIEDWVVVHWAVEKPPTEK